MRKLKRWSIVLLMILVVGAIYVEIANRNTKQMTYRQKLLKAFYPALMWVTKLTGSKIEKAENTKVTPQVPFYSLSGTKNDGKSLDFSQFKGKKVLLVNTASDCGYTNQYADLQALYEQFKGKLEIVGFPANDFKEQEKGSDEDIAQFCKVNFGVSFPLMKKSVVIKASDQNAVFKWLSDSTQNGWNQKEPSWNFSKYLVNEQGVLTHYFDPSVSPLSEEVKKSIEKE